MTKIIFATGNEGKMREIRMILADLGVEIQSMKEAGITADIVEDGTTFEENAVIKARAIAKIVNDMENCKKNIKETVSDAEGKNARTEMDDIIVLADDSGLEIDYLNGEPGIYSARYMGEDTSYHIKNQNLIDRLSGVPEDKRTARFVCAIAAAFADGTYATTKGVMEGYIGYAQSGGNGFGYDPIFILPQYGCTTADLDPETKNKESHRGKALRAIKEELQKKIHA